MCVSNDRRPGTGVQVTPRNDRSLIASEWGASIITTLAVGCLVCDRQHHDNVMRLVHVVERVT